MKTIASLTVLTLTAVLSGCKNGDLTPELSGTSMTHGEATNAYEVAMNQNVRGFSDDFRRTFYIDHPSRLSPFPIIYTSGQPR